MKSAFVEERFTPGGVRLRCRRNGGAPHWLLVPGGPGLGSESLLELADTLAVPGSIWLVDLPGDGSHRPASQASPYANWPHVLVEAAEAFDEVVMVGHSTGGMYLLSVPALEDRLKGLALLCSAPDARWMARFAAMAAANPIAEASQAVEAFAAHPDDASLKDLTLASAPWSFPQGSLAAGRTLLARLPYCLAANLWSAAQFDEHYVARWWPRHIPMLILSGEHDRVVDQSLWDETPGVPAHALRRTVAGGGHFPWLDNPCAVRDAFDDLAALAGKEV